MFPALKEFLTEFLARVLKRKKEESWPVITVKPVKVVDIWGWSAGNRRASILSSLIAHFLVLLFIQFASFDTSFITRNISSI